MQKYILTLLLVLSLPILAFAQLERGMRNFEDNSQYQLHLSDDINGIFGQFSNQQGWMLTDKLFLGTDYGLGLSSSWNATDLHLITGPFIRYYLNPASSNVNFFLNADSDLIIFFDDGLSRNLNVELSAGFNKFLQPDFALRGQIGLESIGDFGEPNLFIAADLENFINQVAWDNRRSTLDPSAKGSLLLGNPNLRLSIIPDRFNVFILNSAFGYFVSDDFVLGLDLGLNISGDFSNIRLAPFLRYYVTKARTSWFLQAEVGPNIRSFNGSLDNSFSSTNTTWDYFAGLGFNKFLSPNVAVEAQFGLFDNTRSSNIMSLAGSFGMQYYLHP